MKVLRRASAFYLLLKGRHHVFRDFFSPRNHETTKSTLKTFVEFGVLVAETSCHPSFIAQKNAVADQFELLAQGFHFRLVCGEINDIGVQQPVRI